MELICKNEAIRAVLHNQGDAAMVAVQNIKTVDAVPVPCYVGDEIWYVPEWNKKPFKAVCHCISIDKGGVRVHLYDMDGDNATYPARLVFKTKEDAERYIMKRAD